VRACVGVRCKIRNGSERKETTVHTSGKYVDCYDGVFYGVFLLSFSFTSYALHLFVSLFFSRVRFSLCLSLSLTLILSFSLFASLFHCLALHSSTQQEYLPLSTNLLYGACMAFLTNILFNVIYIYRCNEYELIMDMIIELWGEWLHYRVD